MRTIRVVLDEPLLRAADRAARRLKVNRSELMRDALREHLRGLTIREPERRDREGYERHPENAGDRSAWEKAAAWPKG